MKSSSLKILTTGLLLFLLFAASESVRAQQSDSPRNPLTINTDLVVTWAQVLDRKDGKPVKGLEIDDKLAALIRGGKSSPGLSGIGQK